MAEDTSACYRISAPGFLLLNGEYGSIYGKSALAASIDLKTSLILEIPKKPSGNSKIQLNMPNLHLYHLYSVKDLTKELLSSPLPLTYGSQRNGFSLEKPDLIDIPTLVERVKWYLHKVTNIMPLNETQERALLFFFVLLTGMFSSVTIPLDSMCITVRTDIPSGMQLGQSVACYVCFAAALLHYIRYKISVSETCKDISKKGLKPCKYIFRNLDMFDDHEKAIICNWVYLGERISIPSSCGIDSIVSTYGSVICYKRARAESKGEVVIIPDPKIIKVLLVDAGYRSEYSNMTSRLVSLKDRHNAVVETIISAMDELNAAIVDVVKHISRMMNNTRVANNAHLPAEYELAELGVSIISSSNSRYYLQGCPGVSTLQSVLQELTDMYHMLLRSLGLTSAKVDVICNVLHKWHFHGKMAGAGCSGLVFVVLPPLLQHAIISRLHDELQGMGFPCLEVRLGGPGVMVQQVPQDKFSEFRISMAEKTSDSRAGPTKNKVQINANISDWQMGSSTSDG